MRFFKLLGRVAALTRFWVLGEAEVVIEVNIAVDKALTRVVTVVEGSKSSSSSRI